MRTSTAIPPLSRTATLEAENTEPVPTEAQISEPSETESLAQEPTQTADSVESFPDASEYQWSIVVDDLRRPVDLAHTGDDRLFVVEQAGVIRIVENGRVLPTPFLDIRDRVNDRGSEQGLLGIAFHPQHTENGAFFLNYTGSGGNTVISRFQVSQDPNLADENNESVLFTINQPYGNHNGGGLKFGPDGLLYIGTGDGGSANDPLGNGQRLDTLLGKILRFDVDSAQPFAFPADNPFVEGGGLRGIWAYGLRNPWRFSFDSLTGDLYIADVGQSQWEEVNFQPAGSPGGVNYGWNLREGAHPFAGDDSSGLTDPVAEYSHQFGCSVTGGVVVRDPVLPAWNGVYLYGDYCTGIIWGLLHTPDGSSKSSQLFDTNFSISSFGEGPDHQVYLLDLSGAIYRLQSTQ